MLRPLFRETDLTNWQKAALSNSKWVAMLSDEKKNALPYSKAPVPDYGSCCDDDTNISGDNLSSEVPPSPSSQEGVPSSEVPSATPRHLLGVAVIKNAIVVDSTAYLKVGCAS